MKAWLKINGGEVLSEKEEQVSFSSEEGKYSPRVERGGDAKTID